MPHVSAFARGARSVESSSPSRCMPQEFGHAAMRVFVLPLVVSYSQTKSTSFIIEFAVRMVALYTLFRPTRPAAPLRHVASNQQICAGSIPHAVSCGHSLCPPSLASRHRVKSRVVADGRAQNHPWSSALKVMLMQGSDSQWGIYVRVRRTCSRRRRLFVQQTRHRAPGGQAMSCASQHTLNPRLTHAAAGCSAGGGGAAGGTSALPTPTSTAATTRRSAACSARSGRLRA